MPIINIYRQRRAVRNRDTLAVERSEVFSFDPIPDETFKVDGVHNVRTGRFRGVGVFRRELWELRPVQYVHHYTHGTEPVAVKLPIDVELLRSSQPDGTTYKVVRWKRSPIFSTWDTKWRFVFLTAKDLFRLATDGTPNEVGERITFASPNKEVSTNETITHGRAALVENRTPPWEVESNGARAVFDTESNFQPSPNGEGLGSRNSQAGKSLPTSLSKTAESRAKHILSRVVEVGGARVGFGPGIKFHHVHGPHQIDVSDGAR